MSGARGTGLQGWRAAALLLALPLSNVSAALMVGPVEPGPSTTSPTAFAAPVQAGEETEAISKRFEHRNHVNRLWFEFAPNVEGAEASRPKDELDWKEIPRDCRGCHDFGAKDADGNVTREPALNFAVESCYFCHYEERLSLKEEGPKLALKDVVKRLETSRRGQHSFDHLDHDALACRECHAPTTDKPADVSVERGLATCVRCHGEDWKVVYDKGYDVPYEQKNVNEDKLRKGFSEQLDKLLAEKSEDGSGPFLHTDHMTAEELGEPESCAACHDETASLGVDALAEKVFSDSSCTDCHGTEDAPVKIGRSWKNRDSLAARTFSHADHLKRDDPGEQHKLLKKGHEKIQGQDCLACHVHDEEFIDGQRRATFFVEGELGELGNGFKGCMECHGKSDDFNAPRHEEPGFWQNNCADCHRFGTSDLAQDRPVAAVDRLLVGEVRFLVPPQTHPGLGVPKDDDCRKCHKGPMPESPSRLLGERFEHAAHLTREPTTEECLACHAKVGKADTSAAIGLAWSDEEPPDNALFERLSFSMESCYECHDGIQVDVKRIRARDRRKVNEFDHAAHLAVPAEDSPYGAKMDCSTCHEPVWGRDGSGKDIGIKDAAANCTQCHGHDAERAPFSRSIDMTQVGSCSTCHKEHYPGIDGEPLVISQAHATLTGAQVHPENKSDCWECHVEREAELLAGFPDVEAKFSYPKGHPNGIPWETKCWECHFSEDKAQQEIKGREKRKLASKELEPYRRRDKK